MKVIITGTAGFIGWRTAELLLQNGYTVVGIDNLNNYYDVKLKEYRLSKLIPHKRFTFIKGDIEDLDLLKEIFERFKPRVVINLAARAGVRASIQNPFVYYTTNVMGNLNLLELSVKFNVNKFILASTSSLYAGQKMPFKENLPVNEPISPYAASKKSAEVTSYTYHYLYGLKVNILRFFTVYGPLGRPDMAPLRFLFWIYNEEPVIVFGSGKESRDFTYIDDIARGIVRTIEIPNEFEIINLGTGSNPVSIIEVINIYEKLLHKKARIVFKEKNKADMESTWADITKAQNILHWTPQVDIEQGLEKTVKWFLEEGRSIGFKI